MDIGVKTRIAIDKLTLRNAKSIQTADHILELTDAPIFEDKDITLAANNSALNDPKASYRIENITAFVHLYFSKKARLILTNPSGSIMIDVDRFFHSVSPFGSISITNLDTDQAKLLYIKAIYA
jgi:putative NADH-flavin reductase